MEQNAAWEAVSRLPRVSDNIRHVHAAHTAIYSNHIMVLTWTGGFQLLGLEWPRLLVALGLLEPVWGMLSLKDMEWKPGSSISSCKYVCFGGLASSTELRCMEGALPWHCICWMINIYIYTIPAYFCKTDGRCKQRSWSWHTIGLCSSYEHVLSTKRWDSSSFLHMESAPTHSYMIGYGILKVWCNQFSYVRFPLV